MKNPIQIAWMAIVMLTGILFLCGCGKSQDEIPSATPTSAEIGVSLQTTPIESTPSIPVPEETPLPTTEPTLVSEEVSSIEAQMVLDDISLEELQHIISQRNNKPLFLNFWATWCSPCIEEMPAIVELHKKYGKQIDFFAVSCDSFTDSVKQVPDMAKKLNMTFNIRILQTNDQNSAISAIDAEWKGAMPATFIYDIQGKKVKSFMGSQTQETFDAAIQESLKSVGKNRFE